MKRISAFLGVSIILLMIISGCGETVRGVSRDASRIYRGTTTIFVSGR